MTPGYRQVIYQSRLLSHQAHSPDFRLDHCRESFQSRFGILPRPIYCLSRKARITSPSDRSSTTNSMSYQNGGGVGGSTPSTSNTLPCQAFRWQVIRRSLRERRIWQRGLEFLVSRTLDKSSSKRYNTWWEIISLWATGRVINTGSASEVVISCFIFHLWRIKGVSSFYLRIRSAISSA